MPKRQPTYSQDLHASALKLHLEGVSQNEIARRLGVPQYTLSRWFKRESPFSPDSTVAARPRKARTPPPPRPQPESQPEAQFEIIEQEIIEQELNEPAVYRYEYTAEGISELVIDTLVETLKSIRARAIETGRPDWITNQKAAALAELDNTQWTYAIRVLAAYRPANTDDDRGRRSLVQGQPDLPEPAPDDRGAVDSAA
jgi:transposase-like protein